MRFYTRQHQSYCGIDLHARTMFLCIMCQSGNVLLHKNYRADPDAFFRAFALYREDIVVAVECIFTWYWIADLCNRIGFVFHPFRKSILRLVRALGEGLNHDQD